MAKSGNSKYLQLPECDAADIGKPSPLALLAATCQKIGKAPSPSSRRLTTPVQRVEHRVEVPASRTPSPVPTKVSSPEIAVSSYQLPPTPPTTPQASVSPSPSRSVSPAPVPTTFVPASTCGSLYHHPCHPAYNSPALRYSPYTMVVPSRPVLSPPPVAGYVHPFYYPQPAAFSGLCESVVPAMPVASSAMLPQPVFGVYPHHHACSAPGKVRVSRCCRSTSGHRRHDIASILRRDENEIIDVVSV